jgi:hypothetical protein
MSSTTFVPVCKADSGILKRMCSELSSGPSFVVNWAGRQEGVLMLARSLRHLRRHVVAYLALFVALSSSGYAATTKLLPRNSVGSAQVINGSLQKGDLSHRAVAALRGARGPRGPIGAQGPTGAPGPQGIQGRRATRAIPVPRTGSRSSTAQRPPSTIARWLRSRSTSPPA